jgi:hypothetical protein
VYATGGEIFFIGIGYFCNLKHKLAILAISGKVMAIFEVFPLL